MDSENFIRIAGSLILSIFFIIGFGYPMLKEGELPFMGIPFVKKYINLLRSVLKSIPGGYLVSNILFHPNTIRLFGIFVFIIGVMGILISSQQLLSYL